MAVVDVQYDDESVVENNVAEFTDETFLTQQTIDKWEDILANS